MCLSWPCHLEFFKGRLLQFDLGHSWILYPSYYPCFHCREHIKKFLLEISDRCFFLKEKRMIATRKYRKGNAICKLHPNAEAVVQRCSVKKMFLKITKFTGKHLCRRRLWQVFSCGFWEIFKKHLFLEYLWWLLL